jgi:hypothetical protein
MATNFPTSVDVLTNPVSNDSLNSPSHSAQHANANDAIEAIETYVLNLPRGKLNGATATASTAFTGGSSIPVLDVNVTITAGRLYQITGRIAVQATNAISGNALYITTVAATPKTLDYQTPAIGTNLCKSFQGTVTMSAAEFSVTSGSATKNIAMRWLSNSNGSLTTNPDAFVSANSFPQELWVMDIGLA